MPKRRRPTGNGGFVVGAGAAMAGAGAVAAILAATIAATGATGTTGTGECLRRPKQSDRLGEKCDARGVRVG